MQTGRALMWTYLPHGGDPGAASSRAGGAIDIGKAPPTPQPTAKKQLIEGTPSHTAGLLW